jgi:predicted metal-dependent hydrolase
MDARLREGIRLFNDGRYFESHEAWEDFYQRSDEAEKPFIEALIQLAAAFRMRSDFGEVKGPVRAARQALIRLENYQPARLGIKVTALVEAVKTWADTTEKDSTREIAMPKIALQRFGLF